MKSCILLIAHGTRGQTGTRSFWDFIKGLKKVLAGKRVEGCFLELAEPKFPEQLERCYKQGIRSFFLFPVLLFPGRHVIEDIPRGVADFKMKYPDTDFHCAPPLGSDPVLIRLLAAKARAVEKFNFQSVNKRKQKGHGRRKTNG